MTYRRNPKQSKLRSMRGNAKRAEIRRKYGNVPAPDFDPYLSIEIKRKTTGEHVLFECYEGDQINNYSVYCDGKHLGIQSITKLTNGIRKALPAFRRMD